MGKKTKRPKAGDYCRNKFGGKLHKVRRVSVVNGWFQLDDNTGWTTWSHFTPVSKEVVERELNVRHKDSEEEEAQAKAGNHEGADSPDH